MKTKICAKCGSKFNPRSSTQKYCKKIIQNRCAICGNEIQYACGEFEKLTCSDKCMRELNRRNIMKKYGVDNPSKLKSSHEKAKATMLAKYGAESYTATEEYKERVKATCQAKYGVDHHLQAESVIQTRTRTIQDKYGVDNVFQAASVRESIQSTIQERYGVESNISQSPEIQQRIADNNAAKYGVKHPMMLPEYQAKARKTNFDLYGRESFTQQHIKDICKWYEFIAHPKEYISDHYGGQCRSAELAEEFGVDISTIDVYLSKNDAYDMITNTKSIMEQEIQTFIRSIKPDVRIFNNLRSVIAHNELDLYLPDFNLAIECNPTCTHNSSFNDPWGGCPKSYNYHKIKTDLCEKRAYSCSTYLDMNGRTDVV